MDSMVRFPTHVSKHTLSRLFAFFHSSENEITRLRMIMVDYCAFSQVKTMQAVFFSIHVNASCHVLRIQYCINAVMRSVEDAIVWLFSVVCGALTRRVCPYFQLNRQWSTRWSTPLRALAMWRPHCDCATPSPSLASSIFYVVLAAPSRFWWAVCALIGVTMQCIGHPQPGIAEVI
jgi:hypothetical protein